MATLTEKASELRSRQTRTSNATAPQDSGIRLATFPREGGEWRFSWNTFEGKAYCRFQYWTKDESGGYWPKKDAGFTIKLKELADLADGVQEALDLALKETKRNSPRQEESGIYTESNAPF